MDDGSFRRGEAQWFCIDVKRNNKKVSVSVCRETKFEQKMDMSARKGRQSCSMKGKEFVKSLVGEQEVAARRGEKPCSLAQGSVKGIQERDVFAVNNAKVINVMEELPWNREKPVTISKLT